MMATLSIIYNDGDQSTYKYISVKYNGKVTKFNTGDPIVDWINYAIWREKQNFVILYSNTVNKWFLDGNEYFELILNENFGEITKKRLEGYSLGMLMNLPHFIIKKPMKIRNDIEEYYHSKTGKKIKIGPKKEVESTITSNEKIIYYWE